MTKLSKLNSIFLLVVCLMIKITAASQTFTDVSVEAGINLPTGLGDVVVWIEYDNDGYIDFFCSSSSQTSFFKNNGNGTFSEITPQTNLENSEPFSLAVGDYNNDGYSDLLVTSVNSTIPVKVYRNNAGNGFEVAYSTNFHGTRAIWLDYNNDGLLDIFINTGSNAYLLKNLSNNAFGDVTDEMGFNSFSGETSAAADVNNDGVVDIYCCSVSTSKTNRLYLNEAAQTYNDITFSSGSADYRSGVAQSWGDYNNDGLMDLYIGNINSNRNILFMNDGGVHFTDQTNSAGVNDAGDARTNAWLDVNNDGKLDLFTTNHVNPNKLYINNGDETFTNIAQAAGINSPDDGFSVSWGDYDRDGDLDVLISGHSYSTKLLRNEGGNSLNFLNILLKGAFDNRSGIGSRVTAFYEGHSQMMEINGGRGSVSQDDLKLHFGLDDAAFVDSVIILWPSGMKQKMYNLEANQFITITQEGNVPPSIFRLIEPLPDSVNHDVSILFCWNSSVDPDATGQIEYLLNISTQNRDTVIGPLQDTMYFLNIPHWMSNDSTTIWYVTASDGSSTRQSWETWPFYHLGVTGLTETADIPDADFSVFSKFLQESGKDIMLGISAKRASSLSAFMYNMSGIKVKQYPFLMLNEGEQYIKFPVLGLEHGLYILVLQSKKQSVVVKIQVL